MLAHAWDGSPETITVPHCAERVVPILREEGHPALLTDLTSHQSESDAESSDLEEEAMDPLKGLQTRKEAKALEREASATTRTNSCLHQIQSEGRNWLAEVGLHWAESWWWGRQRFLTGNAEFWEAGRATTTRAAIPASWSQRLG